VTLHKALIRSNITYACPAWEFAADSHLLKLQCLQNKVHRTNGNLPRRTSVRDLHIAFTIFYINDYIKNYAGNKQKSNKIMKVKMFATLDKANPDAGNTRGLNLVAVKHTTVQVTTPLLEQELLMIGLLY
jgi:hypothetical protein